MGTASPGASRRPWPSPVFARLGFPLLPLRGLTYRRGRLRFMLRTGELLDPLKGLCHGASPVGSRLAAAVSYRVAWSLPGPDSHRQVSVSLHRIARLLHSTSSLGVPLLGTPKPGQVQSTRNSHRIRLYRTGTMPRQATRGTPARRTSLCPPQSSPSEAGGRR